MQREKLELHLEKSFIRSVSVNQHRTTDCLPAPASQEAPGTFTPPPQSPRQGLLGRSSTRPGFGKAGKLQHTFIFQQPPRLQMTAAHTRTHLPAQSKLSTAILASYTHTCCSTLCVCVVMMLAFIQPDPPPLPLDEGIKQNAALSVELLSSTA